MKQQAGRQGCVGIVSGSASSFDCLPVLVRFSLLSSLVLSLSSSVLPSCSSPSLAAPLPQVRKSAIVISGRTFAEKEILMAFAVVTGTILFYVGNKFLIYSMAFAGLRQWGHAQPNAEREARADGPAHARCQFDVISRSCVLTYCLCLSPLALSVLLSSSPQ